MLPNAMAKLLTSSLQPYGVWSCFKTETADFILHFKYFELAVSHHSG
jgi:hypothetical protein